MSEYIMSYTGEQLDDAINKVQSGYILPTEIINIVENVSEKDITKGKLLNVNVQPSDDYIKKSDTYNYVTRFKSKTFSVPADTRISDVNISVGFNPKIFVIRSNAGISTTSERFYITTAWVVTDNNYAHIMSKPDGTNDARSAGAIGLYYQSGSARSVQSNSINNSFQSVANGVQGNGSTASSCYFKANTQYYWFAWG